VPSLYNQRTFACIYIINYGNKPVIPMQAYCKTIAWIQHSVQTRSNDKDRVTRTARDQFPISVPHDNTRQRHQTLQGQSYQALQRQSHNNCRDRIIEQGLWNSFSFYNRNNHVKNSRKEVLAKLPGIVRNGRQPSTQGEAPFDNHLQSKKTSIMVRNMQ